MQGKSPHFMLPVTTNRETMMLRTLLESQARPTRRRGGTMISIGAHTAIVGLAIAATARATPRPKSEPVQPTIYRVQPPPPTTVEHRTSPSEFQHSFIPAIRNVPVPPFKMPTGLPPIDFTKPITRDGDFYGAHVELGAASPGRSEGRLGSGSIYTIGTVEKPAVPRADNPAPVYPTSLRAASIEGTVLARFIVDTAGRAEPQSIAILAATHPLFGEAVRQALLRSRYLPAFVGERPVRQLVEQRFAFTLTR